MVDLECRGRSQGGDVVDPDCRGGKRGTATAMVAPDRGRRRRLLGQGRRWRLLERERRGWQRSDSAWRSGRGGGRVSSTPASARETGSQRHESRGGESSPEENSRIGVARPRVVGLPNARNVWPGARIRVGARPRKNKGIPRDFCFPKGPLSFSTRHIGESPSDLAGVHVVTLPCSCLVVDKHTYGYGTSRMDRIPQIPANQTIAGRIKLQG